MPHSFGANSIAADPACELAGLGEIAQRYDIVLCDIWGVLHNGVARHPTADMALRQFRQTGTEHTKRVSLVTNMPRPKKDVVTMLDRLHISAEAYDDVASSGDVSRSEISRYAGGVIRHLGSPDYASLFEGLDVTLGSNEEASAIVVTNVDSTFDGGSMYDDQIEIWLKRKLPMICANPDKIVEVGDRLKYCAGALADIYASRGGEVIMAGKPYPPIYEMALEKLGAGNTPRDRILAIGDAVRTDARGAALQDIDFLFISGSVHAEELAGADNNLDEAINALVTPSGVRLVGHMPVLSW